MRTTTLLYALFFLGIGTASLMSLTLAGLAIITKSKTVNNSHKSKQFDSYWNDGKAELSSYELKQARYGEIHNGEAVLIFVTEPFSKSKQVKLDNWRNKEDREDVLKLNAMKKFETGIYPYSTMQSVFNSLNTSRLIKATSSVQEWCGQVFMQFNNDGKHLNYFEGLILKKKEINKTC